jgi:ribosomal protein L37AE/L43A
VGDRYFVEIECPKCGHKEEAYYAPTCGFKDWHCPKCHALVDLAEYTGITEAECSNRDAIERIVQELNPR